MTNPKIISYYGQMKKVIKSFHLKCTDNMKMFTDQFRVLVFIVAYLYHSNRLWKKFNILSIYSSMPRRSTF